MIFYEYEKQIIGYLFRFYRQKNKMRIQHMIAYKSDVVEEYCAACKRKCKNKQSILSHKTIERIERGQVSKSECYYIDISNKFGFGYEITRRNVKKIEEFEKELLDLIQTRNKKGFEQISIRLENFQKQVSGLIYFQEMLDIYKSVVAFELNRKFCDDDSIKMMEFIYRYVREDTKKILLYYFYRYFFRFGNTSKSQNYLKEAEIFYPENLQIEFHKSMVQMNKLDYLSYLLKYDRSQFKGADHFFFYQALALAYINLEKNDTALKYLNKCIKEAKNQGMIDAYLYQSYMRRGVLLYQLGRYDDAIESFKTVYFFNINLMMMNIILFIDSIKRANAEVELPHILIESVEERINNDMISTVYIYYKMKYCTNAPIEALEDYIVKKMKPYLRMGSWYEQIIRDDLITYTDETKNYKKVRLYMGEGKLRKNR